MPPEESSVLDRVIWSALTSHQAPLAVGDETARRFPPDIAFFAATKDDSPESLAALFSLVAVGEQIALFTLEDVTPPAPLEVTARDDVPQFIAPATLSTAIGDTPFARLGADDVDEMIALVRLTNPGPFLRRTIELGDFIGVRHEGRLVAMCGERMHVTGFREVSGLCVHPDFRGRGYAQDLLLTVCRRILARGETPFLHTFAGNHGAIALYEKLGFRLRKTLRMAFVRRP